MIYFECAVLPDGDAANGFGLDGHGGQSTAAKTESHPPEDSTRSDSMHRIPAHRGKPIRRGRESVSKDCAAGMVIHPIEPIVLV